jgi:gamma-glutamyl hercynylcysteine S-oxide synthase
MTLRHSLFPGGVTREDVLTWYRRGRERTSQIFAIPTPDMYYERPIKLRNPIVFYDGHLPAFSVNTLVKYGYGKPGIDEKLEVLFARGIDPEDVDEVNPSAAWPDRATVREYVAAADALVEKTLREEPHREDPVLTILEHEQMHQETFLYMLHNLPYDKKRGGQTILPVRAAEKENERIHIPAGFASLGNSSSFGWDNEFPPMRVHVEAFDIEAVSVTNGRYLEYVEKTGAPAPHFWRHEGDSWFWRGMFELIPLPLGWPVYVTYDEAAAFARWAGGRVMTEAEYDRAAYGDATSDALAEGNFGFTHFDPVPAGSYPPNAQGIYDLVGNGWEWTSTIFDGFPGFTPMASYPNYSADFFDGSHYVLKGGSPATARELIRRSFRNWFRPNYPYLYAKFRVAW